MITYAYSIYDVKGMVYNTPWFSQSDVQAMRSYRGLQMDNTTLIAKFPEDFHLYKLGSFDDVKGRYTELEEPQLLIAAGAPA